MQQEHQAWQERKKKRKEQVGSGMRGDKIRTIAIQRNQVVDHQTNKTTTWKKYKKGDFKDIR